MRVLGAARNSNAQQRDRLSHPLNVPLLIVAGPGTGKTTVLVLRALRAVLVDRIPPEAIMITTFTRNAAREIRTRLIEWGIPLLEHLLAAERARGLDAGYVAFPRDVDIIVSSRVLRTEFARSHWIFARTERAPPGRHRAVRCQPDARPER
jgi:DNA helicase-2/ATP-dependent DNA helicase PcrA